MCQFSSPRYFCMQTHLHNIPNAMKVDDWMENVASNQKEKNRKKKENPMEIFTFKETNTWIWQCEQSRIEIKWLKWIMICNAIDKI